MLFEKMICDEYSKKEGKNEKWMADLCESYLALHEDAFNFKEQMLAICIPCLLKVALRKEKNEETQNEVEMALMALCNFYQRDFIKKELFLVGMSNIIKNHQEHRNLTHLAYQSAWRRLGWKI
ncbi:uncharacterized protein MONOS_5096 [Monocercomonoides exilis]|uniref:uncharacterized protein n=1 Tax=Monocercomonoides exilis TaxID=2049356 RepID=UPI003559FDB7|nr:hypothetical protein MONOS_5096 [Monocercomonoides exilis]|eukprot:MONOS_5096.1-p1 / transcript=MONOS_5096.1 / gene=MONOS_5096 / organism=Monocercomonoides_exilis_PA203 / gene_product=unspecified product / transcript_product=unspecified product / location=Mono_scaffold00144:92264-92802(-) / protein_length=123 / sequence_SO=supercontig / SO=protein_coding / is_pseudo=false